jgi:MFS family permease
MSPMALSQRLIPSQQWTFIIFFCVFEIGSAVCGAAVSSNMLIIGRAIAGIGSAGILNGAYGIIYAGIPLAKQPSMFSS